MERITTTIDGETLAAIRELAGPRGVSSFLQAAARERLMRLRLLGLLDELVTQVLDSMGGFTLVLAGAKAGLEHDIALNLIGDRYPDGH